MTPFLFRSIPIISKFFHLEKGKGFFKIQAKNFALPFPQLSQLVKGEQKLKYSKHFHVCDMIVKVRPLGKIKRKAKAKGSFIFRQDVKLIHADKGGRNRLFVRMMLHKRQSVQDSVQLSLGFYKQEYSNFSTDFLCCGEGKM